MPAFPIVTGFGIQTPPETAERPGTTGAASSSPTSFETELLTKAVAAMRSRAPEARSVVDKRATPLRGGEAASALATAWRATFGEAPTAKTLSTLVAQWSHETGGGSAMMNNNFGGLKGVSPSGMTTAYKTIEGSGETRRQIVDHFRAYRTPAEGAADYLHLLKTHFPGALQAARSGDTAGFVHGLKTGGYFTDSEDTYARSVGSLSATIVTHGYDAVTRTRTAAPPSASKDASSNAADGFASNYDLQRPLRMVDTLALSDEISRAALRIVSAGSRDRDD